MVLPILLNKKFMNKKKKFIQYIEKKGLETRPIISGSFVNQPSTKLYNLNPNNKKFIGAQKVQDNGLWWVTDKKIKNSQIKFVKNTIFY